MSPLPSSIEAYLEEAGFSGTEITILRRLMEGEPLTIRQLGAKTGKSTGVLDQAMKKLIKKDIIRRTVINDTPKYSLDSLEAVVEWMQEDMEQKREMLLRRHQNFESFVTSLENGNKRPDIEYFEGESGIRQAYVKLLNGPGEILHYLPVQHKEEEDPLRDFRVQYFRERQQRKMFSRVLAHDTPLGRRYQSRDAFEYRKTVLVPEEEYPFTFEKIITGDRIACIDHKAQTACIIRYPELADIERTLFDGIWKHAQRKAAGLPTDAAAVAKASSEPERITMATETMSQVREFFLSPKSLAAFGVCAVLAGAVTFGLYKQNVALNLARIQERAVSVASTAALQFDLADLEKIRTPEDIQRPEYAKIIHHLNRIRRENPGVTYIYLMRPTDDPNNVAFIADADSLDPYSKKDLNGDGVIDEEDHLSPPGEFYDISLDPALQRLIAQGGSAIANEEPYQDQWGTFVSGTAPMYDESGELQALLGVDIDADRLRELTSASFWPILSFGGFFVLFVFLRFAALSQIVPKEYAVAWNARRTVVLIVFGFVIAVGCSLWLYARSVDERIESARDKILTIATTGALQFSADQLAVLRSLGDTNRSEYTNVMRELTEIRARNEDIQYAYLIRPHANTTTFEFIADADAFGVSLSQGGDTNGDGRITDEDEIGYPGLPYDVSHIDALRDRAYFSPVVTDVPYTDKWGTVLTGYAPIYSSANAVEALLAIDVNAGDIYAPTAKVFLPIALFFLALLAVILYQKFEIQTCRDMWRWKVIRPFFYGVLLVMMCTYWVFFALHFYASHLKQEEIGKRLMAIAATAASEFDPADLEKLRFARDMRTPEYQRVFEKLNEIRDQNENIQWVYILRPKDLDEGLWEFVADADANYFLGEGIDENSNNFVDDNEINVSPGVAYFSQEKVLKKALNRPSFSRDISTDQWGTFIVGAAPIHDVYGNVIAILGIDLNFLDL